MLLKMNVILNRNLRFKQISKITRKKPKLNLSGQNHSKAVMGGRTSRNRILSSEVDLFYAVLAKDSREVKKLVK